MKFFTGLILSMPFVKTMRGLFFIFLGVVAILSLIPDPLDIASEDDIFAWIARLLFGDPEQSDKVSHFIAYGALAGTATLGLIRPFGRYLVLPALLIAFSGLMELGQGFVSSRVPDLLDMVANAAGVASGSVAALLLLMLAGYNATPSKALA